MPEKNKIDKNLDVKGTGEKGGTKKVHKKKVTIICSKGTLDGAYPSLILALNAVREGADAEVFFTFGGIDVIRKGKAKAIKFYMPGFIGAIPGMATLATWMMKKKVDHANIPPLEELVEMCHMEGVKFIGCEMTMDMMGLKKEDLIEEVSEVLDAHDYVKKALKADVNLFT